MPGKDEKRIGASEAGRIRQALVREMKEKENDTIGDTRFGPGIL